MAEILSNQFMSTVSRTTETTFKEILSNQFTTIINKDSDGSSSLEDDLSTIINIYKKGVLLTPVSGTPAINQYAVAITGTTGCTATLGSDYKTIRLLTINSNTGRIDVRINIENKETYTKSIPVASITGTQEISGAVNEVQQTANKISWLIKSGTSSSNMALTDKLFDLVSKNITLTADHINLNGYVSNDEESWSITNDGLFNTKDMNVDGDVSCDNLTVTNINSPKYPSTLDGTIDIYVNSSTGNDDNDIGDNAVFATLQGAIDAIPKFLNGKTVNITLQNNCTENINMEYFNSGRIFIYFNGKSVNGYIKIYACTTAIYLYGGTADNNTGATGIIHPNTGASFGARTTSLGVEASIYVAVYKLKIYASDKLATSNTEKVCVGAQARAGVYCSDINIVNAVVGFRANNMGCIQMASSSGMASKYGFQAQTGGIIGFHNAAQAGGVTAATNNGSGGQIWSNSPTFASGGATSDSSTSSAVSTTKTITIKSSYGDTYRSTKYNNWKKDNTCRQGDYGYGDCTGVWFFGTAFADVKGKTITKVQITVKRQTGGTSIPVEHKLWMHGHTGRPSGSPTLTSGWSQTFRLATGNSTTVAITNSTVLNAISAGTCKGFALRHSYDSSHYSVCSGSCTVKITYQE